MDALLSEGIEVVNHGVVAMWQDLGAERRCHSPMLPWLIIRLDLI
jgi:hypothetical protein